MTKFICGFILGSTIFGWGVWAWEQTPMQNQIEIDYFQRQNEIKQKQIDQYNLERHIRKEPC